MNTVKWRLVQYDGRKVCSGNSNAMAFISYQIRFNSE